MSETQGNLPVEEQENAGMPDLENSTIFSDPTDYGTNTKNKKHNLRRGAVIGAVLLSAGVLAGGWFAIKTFLPQLGVGGTSSVGTPSGTGEAVTSADYEQVKSLTVTAGDKTVTLLNVSAMEQKPNTVDKWIVQGVDPAVTSSNIVSYRVEDACAITALRTLEKGADYGLDKPTKVIEAVMKDGSGFTLTVGKEAPDNSGFYCSVSTAPDKVYLVETSKLSLIDADPLHYADKEVITPLQSAAVGESYFQGESNSLSHFEKITVWGDKIDGKISLGMTKDTTKYNLYSLTSPITAFADEAAVLNLLSPIADGYTVSRAVSYDFGKDKAKFGLADPAYVAEYKIGDYSEKIWVSAPDADGVCYMAVGEDPLAIYATYISGLPFEGLTVTGLYTPYPFFENIVTVEQISISGPKGKYVFDLSHFDVEDRDEKLKVLCGDTVIDTPSFRYFYQHLVKVSAISFTTEKNTSAADITIRVKFLEEGAKDTVLTFVKISDLRYHLSVNGTPYGIVADKDVETLFSDCATITSGGTLNS